MFFLCHVLFTYLCIYVHNLMSFVKIMSVNSLSGQLFISISLRLVVGKPFYFLAPIFFLDFSCSFPLLYLHVRSRCLLQFSFVVLWKKCIHTWPLPLFCSLCRSCFFVCICLCTYVCVRMYMFFVYMNS